MGFRLQAGSGPFDLTFRLQADFDPFDSRFAGVPIVAHLNAFSLAGRKWPI